jgi:hypothetical protein
VRASGPPDVVRVGLTSFRWPLDPALAQGRDETVLARALFATPLVPDPVTGRPLPGLCRAWAGGSDFREWRFTCRVAPSIAAALRRIAKLKESPLNWAFVNAKITAPSSNTLRIRLPFSWRRFPYVLTSVATAPRFLSGPFSLVSGSSRRVVVRREGLTVVFRKLPARVARAEFRAGKLDEAAVPLGDIAATRADERLVAAMRVRTLLGLDLVLLHIRSAALRRAYWETANRGDYEQLVPELDGSAAYGFTAVEAADPARFRSARQSIPGLPHVAVRLQVAPDPVLRYGARLLYADWRDVGLGPRLVASNGDASFERLVAPYAQAEALPAQLVLTQRVPGRTAVLRLLGATQQTSVLETLDERLRNTAVLVPVAWVVDARLVSPRLQGWHEDVLGDVDYAAVRSRALSRRP